MVNSAPRQVPQAAGNPIKFSGQRTATTSRSDGSPTRFRVTAAGPSRLSIHSAVIPVAHEEIEPISPFEDPFGDRLAQNADDPAALRGSSSEGQIEQTAPAPPADGPDLGPSPIEPSAVPSEGMEPSPLETPRPEPAMPLDSAEQAPEADDSLFPERTLPAPDRADDYESAAEPDVTADTDFEGDFCWQFFAERDFCDEQSECSRGWEDIRDNPLSNISLNISPRFASATYRQQRLAKNARRKWFNRWNQGLGWLGGKVLGLDDKYWNLDMAPSVDFRRPSPLEGRWLKDSDDGQFAIVEVKDESDESGLRTVTVQLPWNKLSRYDRLFVRGRKWVDRLGRERAFGRLSNLYKGEVHIETEDGEIVKVPFLALGEDEMSFVAAEYSIPAECKLPDVLLKMPQDQRKLRDYTMITYTWTASSLCHKPLYFEQRALERYGHSTGPISQPILSGAHFFGSFFIWPYKMGIAPPHECQYALGYYRPGSCAPYLVPPIPLSPRGALLQAGTVVGLVYLLP